MPARETPGLDFLVKRDAWHEHRFVESGPPGDLAAGRVRFRIDRFALTANNISYAKAGDLLRYWDFFPAEPGWGRIPTMGFADVLHSTHPDVAEGERFFGFFPMSRYLEIEPGHTSKSQVMDGAAHREGIAPAYNGYTRTASDEIYAPEHEDAHMLMWGLFLTSFLIHDYLTDNACFGAQTAVISSASSKTSIALAHLLSASGELEVVGLTSARNADFVRGLGSYDRTLLYEEVEDLAADRPSVFVDMAGDGDVTGAVHRRLGDRLRYSGSVGATHWDASARADDLPGATPEFFFAPGQMQKRAADWGPDGLRQRMGDAWTGFRDASEAWLHVRRSAGRDGLVRVYEDTLAGRTAPSDGHVVTLQEG
jgi:hypothetical protein